MALYQNLFNFHNQKLLLVLLRKWWTNSFLIYKIMQNQHTHTKKEEVELRCVLAPSFPLFSIQGYTPPSCLGPKILFALTLSVIQI